MQFTSESGPGGAAPRRPGRPPLHRPGAALPRPGMPAPARPGARALARVAAALALAFLVACSGLSTPPRAADAAPPVPTTGAESPQGRGDVILNLFQWTWDAVAAECTSTIGPAGFGYVQVSPPQETIRGTEWWTSYQPVSYRIEGKLGTRAEFAAMVDSCNSAGVEVIADAVINHTTGVGNGSGTGVAGTPYGVDDFPGLYGAEDFHDCRTDISDYTNRWQVQNCRLVGLQDLRTESDDVRTTIAAYMNDLLDLGVAGFRIDAAKHIPAEDLVAIKAELSDPDVYWVQEVIGAPGEPIQPSEYLGSGDSHEFAYSRELKTRFDGRIKDLRTIGDGKLLSASAGVFVDNHDTERNAETMNETWGAKYVLANTFMLSWPYGSPSVYSGYRFTDKDAGVPGSTETTVPDADCASATWTCTQRWTEIQGMVGFHNQVAGTEVTNWWDDGGNHIAYGRGAKGYVSINNTGASVTRTYQTSLPSGTYCDVIAADDCSQTITVAADGTFTATLPAYGALALHVGALSGGDAPQEGDPTTVAVDFAVTASTVWGQDVYVVGSIPQLGAWSTGAAVKLSAATYPTWTGAVDVPAGTTFEYKYIKKDASGAVTWESGANRTATATSSDDGTGQDTWR
ncbi:carbohydrate-binding module family 20 domain-containing protein [Brachybacterium phenoliresistens]|uniref:carbohydrate-binding module family 20 domain-containing protein n=1 Tax=Brachybacterium phenoliresistens TaxID=396014 RepID=UPI0004B2BD45|nr:carbohydrate-binding module family 20 domain-containing protein [Brachybacterium phenoliresistens]